MRRVLAIWLIAFLSLINLAAADVPPIPFDGYWELVRSTRQAVVRLEASPDGEVRAGLNALVSKWETVTAVEFPDQNVVAIDPSHLISELKNDPPDLKRLAALMDALLEAHVREARAKGERIAEYSRLTASGVARRAAARLGVSAAALWKNAL